MQWIKPGTNIDFMGKTKLAVTASAIAVTLSLVGIFVWPGPRYGVDFAGGAALQVKMKDGISPNDVSRALKDQGYESPEVVSAQGGTYLIRVRVDAPSDAAREGLAAAIRGAVEKAMPYVAPVATPVVPAPVEPVVVPPPVEPVPVAPVPVPAADAAAAEPVPPVPAADAAAVEPVVAPPAVEPVALPPAPEPAPAPAVDPAAPAPPPAFQLPLRGLVGALAGASGAKQLPPVEADAAVAPVEPPPPVPEAVPEPVTAAVPPVAPETADAGAATTPEAPATDAGAPLEPVADVVAADEATEPVVADAALVPVVADAAAPSEPVVPPVAEAAPEAPPTVRVDEVIVDTSGAKVDILVNRPFAPAELRDLLSPIRFEGRAMADMIGQLIPDSDSITETVLPDGSFRYDALLSPVVNLNDQDVGAVRDIVKGAVEAAALAEVGTIKAIEVTLAPISLRIDTAAAMDRQVLADTLNRTRYRDVNLFVRCRSAVCPASIDEREGIYGYQINLRGFGPDVVESLQERLGPDSVQDVLSMEWVGPKVGEKLRDDGIKSVLIALALILIYVGLRFDLRFAPGAVLCLFHDAIITLGFFTFARMEVNLTTVAAVLTIVGYSINDTIVVYDRIRENMQKTQERDLSKVINGAINDTLSRTLLTSFTTILAVVSVTIFGRGTIQDFSIAMTIGILVGTYSSVYVAAPLSILMDKTFFHRNA
jgi:preprotein translocase subunit SecF